MGLLFLLICLFTAWHFVKVQQGNSKREADRLKKKVLTLCKSITLLCALATVCAP